MKDPSPVLVKAILGRLSVCLARGGSLCPGGMSSQTLAAQKGEYPGYRLRPRGLVFEALREYVPGDDPRHIDWKATARHQRPYVRQYTDPHEQVLNLVVDVSPSMGQVLPGARVWDATQGPALVGGVKRLHAAYGVGLAVAWALAHGYRVALALVTDRLEYYLPARRSGHTLDQVVRCLLGFRAVSNRSHFAKPLAQLLALGLEPGWLGIVSDWRGQDPQESVFRPLLSACARRHYTMAFAVRDPLDGPWPEDLLGLWCLADSETHQQLLWQADAEAIRAHNQQLELSYRAWQAELGAAGIPLQSVFTAASLMENEPRWLGWLTRGSGVGPRNRSQQDVRKAGQLC